MKSKGFWFYESIIAVNHWFFFIHPGVRLLAEKKIRANGWKLVLWRTESCCQEAVNRNAFSQCASKTVFFSVHFLCIEQCAAHLHGRWQESSVSFIYLKLVDYRVHTASLCTGGRTEVMRADLSAWICRGMVCTAVAKKVLNVALFWK